MASVISVKYNLKLFLKDVNLKLFLKDVVSFQEQANKFVYSLKKQQKQ